MTVKTIQKKLLKLLASKAEGFRWLNEKHKRGDWDYSASLSRISSEVCALKEACEAGGVGEWKIHEAIYPTKSA